MGARWGEEAANGQDGVDHGRRLDAEGGTADGSENIFSRPSSAASIAIARNPHRLPPSVEPALFLGFSIALFALGSWLQVFF